MAGLREALSPRDGGAGAAADARAAGRFVPPDQLLRRLLLRRRGALPSLGAAGAVARARRARGVSADAESAMLGRGGGGRMGLFGSSETKVKSGDRAPGFRLP